jgi:hypothetical protein
MKRSMSGVIKITGALALASGMIMMAALPAVAAPPNEAYAAYAVGPISSPPIGLATFPTPQHVVTLPNANIPGLLTTGFLVDKAFSTRASSWVTHVKATLHKLKLKASAVYSSCHFHPRTGTVSGYTKITWGYLYPYGRPTIGLPWYPAPNTVISVPGVATVVLNRQTTAPDGTLTVTAIVVLSRHKGKGQELSLATSVCNKAKLVPVPILPGKSLPLTLGGLGVLLIGGVAYRARRRGRFAAAA